MLSTLNSLFIAAVLAGTPVSYTHLDVYKRQAYKFVKKFSKNESENLTYFLCRCKI